MSIKRTSLLALALLCARFSPAVANQGATLPCTEDQQPDGWSPFLAGTKRAFVLIASRGPVNERDGEIVVPIGGLNTVITTAMAELAKSEAARTDEARRHLVWVSQNGVTLPQGHDAITFPVLNIPPQSANALGNDAHNDRTWTLHHGGYDGLDPLASLNAFREHLNHAHHLADEISSRVIAPMNRGNGPEELWLSVQDFQNAAVLGMLREQIAARHPSSVVRVMHQSHIPYPDNDVARGFGELGVYLENLLRADIVALQHRDDVDRLLGHADQAGHTVAYDALSRSVVLQDTDGKMVHRTRVIANPVSVSRGDIQRVVDSQEFKDARARFREELNNRVNVVMAHRVDVTKGWIEFLDGVAHLLETQPQLATVVHFSLSLVATRDTRDLYQQFYQRVKSKAEALKQRYPNAFTLHLRQGLPYAELRALEVASDKANISVLGSAWKEGMGLPALEARLTAEAVNAGGRVTNLIAAGATAGKYLNNGALAVRFPNNPKHYARLLERAIRMSTAERQARHEAELAAMKRYGLITPGGPLNFVTRPMELLDQAAQADSAGRATPRRRRGLVLRRPTASSCDGPQRPPEPPSEADVADLAPHVWRLKHHALRIAGTLPAPLNMLPNVRRAREARRLPRGRRDRTPPR